jgi:predicted nuclease of predicted toxin-antitoxin system
MQLSVYLDEDVSPVYAVVLKQHGLLVTDAAERDKKGESDVAQLAYCIENGALLITHNIKDFTELAKLLYLSGGHHPGIVGINQLDRDKRHRKINEIASKLAIYLANKLPDELRDTISVI